MNQAKVLNFFGLLLIMFGISFAIPLFVAVFYGESLVKVFGLGMSILVLLGFLSWFFTKDDKQELSLSDGFVITVLFWVVLSVSGSIPFLLFGFSVVDSFFESMSGITTTGATVIAGLDDLPKSLLIYRQLLQWLGGMGLIKSIIDSDGKKIKQAVPSAAVEVLGLNSVPNAGDQFQVVKNDKQAREIAEYRVSKEKNQHPY